MGLLDSIGNLGGLGQITKALDPGQWSNRESTASCRRTWPSSATSPARVVDVNTGNMLGAAQLGMDAMKDLPQATKSLQQQGQQGAATTDRRPARTRTSTRRRHRHPEADRSEVPLMDVLKQLTALLNGGGRKGRRREEHLHEARADTSTKPETHRRKHDDLVFRQRAGDHASDEARRHIEQKTTTSSSTSSGKQDHNDPPRPRPPTQRRLG